jgi:ATP-dependent HslUV protease ATP-binding subunit HslU
MERLLDEISFDAPDRSGTSVTIDEAYVNRMLAEVVANDDLSPVYPLMGPRSRIRQHTL